MPIDVQVPLAQLFEQLHSSENGLTSPEARTRLKRYGPNAPAPPRRSAAVRELFTFIVSPLVLILLLASLVTALLGDFVNSGIIVVIVLLSVALDFFQTYRSQRAADRLRQDVAPTSTVLRDGRWMEIARRELVPGDVIRLAAGDLVPADARLIESRDLHVQQAALTGESLPVEKEAQDPSPAASTMKNREQSSNQGNETEQPNLVFLGTSVVSGTATAIIFATGGDTAFGDIVARLAARAPETEFERGTRQFGVLILRVVLFLVLFVFLVSAVEHHSPLESLLFAVALAVGLTPEFLPVITSITLAQGAVHMSRQKVIVKHLSAIENFGSMDILCSDKTGTLTSGEMTLDQHLDPLGTSDKSVFLLAYVNSSFETGVPNPMDQAILAAAAAHLNPLDVAILKYAQPDIKAYQKLDEIPFDFERRCVSIVVKKDDKPLLITKGAPENLLPLCRQFAVNGAVQPLDDAARKRCEKLYEELSAKGLRTLAVGFRELPVQATYRVTDEKDLTLSGYLTFIDPPLPDSQAALEDLRRDGVAVKILTGDNELVAQNICAQVHLDAGNFVLGTELSHVSDAALGSLAEQTVVFARVSPAQKNRIILALKSRGHVVGYLGDGINDAPSLHAADVGISVSSAVDVAKDAADIILLERGLRVLHSGILEGRKAFGNVMKYLLMGTSSNFGNVFSMAIGSIFLPFLPMLPTQILLNNFLYDIAQVTIPTDNVDASFIQKPRRWDINIIRNFMLFIGPISSIYDFLTFFVLLNVFQASERLFHTGWFVESLATQTLVVFVIRTTGNPFRSRPSVPLVVTVVAVVLIGIVLPYTSLAAPLGFVPLPPTYFIFLAVATATYLLLVQILKRRLMRGWGGAESR